MKKSIVSQKGITLTSLVIYIMVASIIIGIMTVVSANFYTNIHKVKLGEEYSNEFMKFNMFFILDIKNNKTAVLTNSKVEFGDGTIYVYKSDEKAIYRNSTKLAENVTNINFSGEKLDVANISKNIIKVKITIGDFEPFEKDMEYIMKYW